MVLLACVFTGSSSISHAQKTAVMAEKFEVSLRKKAGDFLDNLNPEQQGECLQKMETKARWHKQYTGGKREGIQIKKLNVDQKKSLESARQFQISFFEPAPVKLKSPEFGSVSPSGI